MPVAEPRPARKRARHRILNWKTGLGVAISAVFLYVALHDVDFALVAREFRRANPVLFVTAIAVNTVMFVIRAWRWKPILAPVKPDSAFRPRFAATTIGFMGNNLLPARMGEFARAYALSRLERVPITASLGSLVVERLFDGLTMVALLVVALLDPSFPGLGEVTLAGQPLSALLPLTVLVIVGLTVVLLAMVIWPRPAVRVLESVAEFALPRALRRPVVDALEAFLKGVGAIRHPLLVLRAAGWSLALWLVGAFSFWLAFLAFDIHVPFAAALFVQSLIALAVSAPSAPGFFGPFEIAARVGLVGIFGIEVNKAASFALGFHAGGFVPVTVMGLYYVWRLGISWTEVERSEEIVETVVEEVAGVDPDAPRTAPNGSAAGTP